MWTDVSIRPDVNNSVAGRRRAANWSGEERERQDGDRPGARGPR